MLKVPPGMSLSFPDTQGKHPAGLAFSVLGRFDTECNLSDTCIQRWVCGQHVTIKRGRRVEVQGAVIVVLGTGLTLDSLIVERMGDDILIDHLGYDRHWKP